MEEELVGLIGKLIEFVEMASPQLWEMARREVYVSIVQGILFGICCLVAGALLVKWTR